MVTLTFADLGLIDVINGTLPDGQYELTIDGSRITDVRGQVVTGDAADPTSGDLVYGNNQTTEPFFRRYGDLDGNGRIDGTVTVNPFGQPHVTYGGEFGAFVAVQLKRRGEAGYLAVLDTNGDDVIDHLDLAGANFIVDDLQIIFL